MNMILVVALTVVKLTTASMSGDTGEEFVVYRGFPVGVLCSYPKPLWFPFFFEEEDNTPYTTCIIRKDGVVILNRTTDPDSFNEMGIFDEADDSWDRALIDVIISDSGNVTLSKEANIKLEDPPKYGCNYSSPFGNHWAEVVVLGKPVTLYCHHDVTGIEDPVMMQIPDYLRPNYTVWWYKGCQKIARDDPDFEYVDDRYELDTVMGTMYASLKVKNASFTSTPAEYSCVLENSNDADKTFYLSSRKLCVEREYQTVNNPSIKMSQKHYNVEPGSDLEVKAAGNAADEYGSASLWLTWEKILSKDKYEDVCFHIIGESQDEENCKSIMHKNKKYCEPVPQDEIRNIFLERMGDNYTATLYIRAASMEHSGTYRVVFTNPKGAVSANFTITVKNDVKEEPYRWTVAVIVAGVLVVVAVVLLTLLNMKRTDVRYIVKKVCGKYQRTNKPMTFLIYSKDVGSSMPGVLEAVTQVFGGRRYYDANNAAGAIETNQVGMLVHEHVVLMMGQSLSVMIFVTENLLAGNDMEHFDVYQGLEENIRQALPLIFICTKAIRRKVLDGKFDKVNNALRTFMLHQKSKIIIWDENNISSFRRGLYVALPKVPHVGVEEEAAVHM